MSIDELLSVVSEALHYFGAHRDDSPCHSAWVALDKFLGPADSGGGEANAKLRQEAFDKTDCANGPGEDGNWPCDPAWIFGSDEAECQACGRIARMAAPLV